MDWREKCKCRQWLKCTSVFLYTPTLWREWGGNWQGASGAGEAEGWVGSQATPAHPQAVSWAASPRHRNLPGAGGDRRALGSWDCHSYTLSCLPSLTHVSESLTGTALSPPREWSLGCLWSPSLQGICSPTRLGSCHLMGYFWDIC